MDRAHGLLHVAIFLAKLFEWLCKQTEVGSPVDADEVYEEVEEWRPMDRCDNFHVLRERTFSSLLFL